MKRTCVTVIVALLLGVGAGSAQGQTTVLSETTWGGSGREAPAAVVVAVDGSSYVTGTSDSFTVDRFGTPTQSIFLVKFTASGALAWQRIWNGPTFTGGFSEPAVALHPGAQVNNAVDDFVYVTGLTVGPTGSDAVLLKFDALGNLVWQKTWGGLGQDESQAVATAADGSIYIAGHTTSFGASGAGIFVVKFNPEAGAPVWQKVWDGSGGLAAIAVAPDGNVYVAGSVGRPPGIGEFDLVALKITSAGALTWQRTYAAGDVADPRAGMTVATDGSIYIAGALQAPKMGFVPINALVVRLSADGALLSDGTWGGGNEAASGIAAAPDGSIYFTGTTTRSGAGGQDPFVVHLLANGKVAGAATWGGTGFDEGGGVAVASDGTIRLAAGVQAPPYSLLPAVKKMTNVKATLAVATAAFGDAFGTVATAGGAVITPTGGTTFAGNVDAALVRLAP
jgi:hypothetical protein